MWFFGIALAALIVMLASAKRPEVLLVAVLLPLIVGTWMLSTRWNLKTYVLLGIQIPQPMMLLRVGVADFFMHPAIVRTALTVLRTRSSVATHAYGSERCVRGADDFSPRR